MGNSRFYLEVTQGLVKSTTCIISQRPNFFRLLLTVVNNTSPFCCPKTSFVLRLEGARCGKPDLPPPLRWPQLSAASMCADRRGLGPRTLSLGLTSCQSHGHSGWVGVSSAFGRGVLGKQRALPASSEAAVRAVTVSDLRAPGAPLYCAVCVPPGVPCACPLLLHRSHYEL